jgi:hypothetical protein
LENALLSEAQVLRALAAASLRAGTLELIARHPRWSQRPSVRAALARHPQATAGLVLPLLPSLLRHELEELGRVTQLAPEVRAAIRRELEQRSDQPRSGDSISAP